MTSTIRKNQKYLWKVVKYLVNDDCKWEIFRFEKIMFWKIKLFKIDIQIDVLWKHNQISWNDWFGQYLYVSNRAYDDTITCARSHKLTTRRGRALLLLLSLKMNNLRTGCVLFIVAVSFCTAQRSPSITFISEDQVVDVGGTVELSCSVQYGTEYSVIWLKTGRNIRDSIFLSTGTSLVVKESRFALLYDGASATYTVLIKDLQETDAGLYQCEVVLSVNNKITAETHLSVRRPPVITDNSTQAIVTSEGESVNMECYANGFPPPKIVWRRENNALLPTGESSYAESYGSIIKACR